MDFITGLLMTQQGHDSIWVIVDRLTKSAHFIPVNTRYLARRYADLYISQIVRLHGVHTTIISDRGPKFIAYFQEHLHQALGTKLIRSSAYHPQTSGQTERVNQILEDMLRACVISSNGSWRNGYLQLSSPTTTVIKQASRWLCFKPCMVENVELP